VALPGGLLPGHSGGTAPASHRLPRLLTRDCGIPPHPGRWDSCRVGCASHKPDLQTSQPASLAQQESPGIRALAKPGSGSWQGKRDCCVQQRTWATAAAPATRCTGIRTILRCGAEKLTDKQKARLDKAIAADERHEEVHIAWQCAQQLRSAYQATNLAEGRQIAEKVRPSLR
jgi:hypothetical protein